MAYENQSLICSLLNPPQKTKHAAHLRSSSPKTIYNSQGSCRSVNGLLTGPCGTVPFVARSALTMPGMAPTGCAPGGKGEVLRRSTLEWRRGDGCCHVLPLVFFQRAWGLGPRLLPSRLRKLRAVSLPPNNGELEGTTFLLERPMFRCELLVLGGVYLFLRGVGVRYIFFLERGWQNQKGGRIFKGEVADDRCTG